jgi:hypothetical protein
MWLSYSGIATVKALKGDWDGARATMEKQRDAAVMPEDKIEATYWSAFTRLGAGRAIDAFAIIDAGERAAIDARLQGLAAAANLMRGDFMIMIGRYPEALEHYALAAHAPMETVSEGYKKTLTNDRLSGVIEAASRAGDLNAAKKAFEELEAKAKAAPADVTLANQVARGRGLIAIAKKDFKGAVSALSKCTDIADACRVTLAEALEKSGDAAGARAARQAFVAAGHRNPLYWVLHAQAELVLSASGKKVVAAPKK